MAKQMDYENIINFLEEFSWILKNYNNETLAEDITKFIKHKRNTSINFDSVEEFTPENPNIAFLVGTLPSLFMNRKLFPKNEDIVNFAEKVLKVKITRRDKRSQYELIGLIMCEVTKLDDTSLIKVVNALKKYTPIKNKTNEIYNWNEVIRQLSGEDINE